MEPLESLVTNGILIMTIINYNELLLPLDYILVIYTNFYVINKIDYFMPFKKNDP